MKLPPDSVIEQRLAKTFPNYRLRVPLGGSALSASGTTKRNDHLYITNLLTADYSAPDIAKLYQSRWEVELLFRELKTVYGLDEINSIKPEVVEALILIGLLSLVVSRTLKELFLEIIDENCSDDDVEPSSLLPRERWARAFSCRSDRILHRVAERLGYKPPSLVEALLNDALNPNAHRISYRSAVSATIQA